MIIGMGLLPLVLCSPWNNVLNVQRWIKKQTSFKMKKKLFLIVFFGYQDSESGLPRPCHKELQVFFFIFHLKLNRRRYFCSWFRAEHITAMLHGIYILTMRRIGWILNIFVFPLQILHIKCWSKALGEKKMWKNLT